MDQENIGFTQIYVTSEYEFSVYIADLVPLVAVLQTEELNGERQRVGAERIFLSATVVVYFSCNTSWCLRRSAIIEMQIQLGGTHGSNVMTTSL